MLTRNQTVYLGGGHSDPTMAHMITKDGVEVAKELECDHEEGDTRVYLHNKHAVDNGAEQVIVRSPDTDVLILGVSLLADIRTENLVPHGNTQQ